MGTHGASGFREFFIGTNAFAVVKHAPCPVLTVPPNRKWESFSNILFPVRNTARAWRSMPSCARSSAATTPRYWYWGCPETSRPASKNWVDDNVRRLKSDLSYDGVIWRTQMLEPTDRAAAEVLETAARERRTSLPSPPAWITTSGTFSSGRTRSKSSTTPKYPCSASGPSPPNDARQAIQSIQADYGPAVSGIAYPRAGLVQSAQTL